MSFLLCVSSRWWLNVSLLERSHAALESESLGKIRLEFDAVPRLPADRDLTVADFRQAGHQVAIPGAVKGSNALLNQGVRRVEREVSRSGQDDRTCAVVWRNRKMPSLGH